MSHGTCAWAGACWRASKSKAAAAAVSRFNGRDGHCWNQLAYHMPVYISIYHIVIYLSYQILAHTSHTFLCLPSFGLANQFGFLQPFAINAPPCSSHPAWSSARFKLRCPKSFLKSALETIPVGLSYNSFCCPGLRDRKRDKWK